MKKLIGLTFVLITPFFLAGCPGYGVKGQIDLTPKDSAKLAHIFNIKVACKDFESEKQDVRVRDIASLAQDKNVIKLALTAGKQQQIQRLINEKCQNTSYQLILSSAQFFEDNGEKKYPQLAGGKSFGSYKITGEHAVIDHLLQVYQRSVKVK